jgi:hypothetical protein
MTVKTLSAACLLFVVGLVVAASASAQVIEEVEEIRVIGTKPPAPRVVPTRVVGPGESKPDDTKPTAQTDDSSEPDTRVEVGPINPRAIKLNLQDGSTITGELTVDEITVNTDFGPLTVPVSKLKSFKPGLSSYPELLGKITGLIDDLGGDDFKAREQAHKDLSKWGIKVRAELERRAADDNAERKRHLAEILKELDEQAQDEDEDGTPEQPWIRGDTITTSEFTIVGKISLDTFKVTSKYGPLNVALADISSAERAVGRKSPFRRTVNVEGNNLVQRSFKASGIRVERGDKISIRADGTIQMSPWGGNMNSTPDGGANYGVYQQFHGGALLAKIGNNGKLFKVGSKHTFVAQQAGVLHFAVAMQDQYSQEGYAFPGQYNVKVLVEPK